MLSSTFNITNAELRGRVIAAADFPRALDFLAELATDMGFSQTLYGYIPVAPKLPNGDWMQLRPNIRNFPKGWEFGWREFMKIDPYYRACFGSTLPIDWKEVNEDENLTPCQRKACDYLGDFGMSRGITVPVHLPFRGFAVMSFIADSSCNNWEEVRARAREPVFRIMHVFTKLILDCSYEDQIETAQFIHLTSREKECLTWASNGKTSSEIAQILDRSVETVRLHIKNSISKLEATNRSQAIANAIHLGLI